MSAKENSKMVSSVYRNFGFVFAAGMVLIFGLFLPWMLEKPWPVWPWLVAVFFTGVAALLPGLLAPVYVLWMKLGHVLGWVNTCIILGLVFIVIFLPISILMKLFGRDPMRREIDPSCATYRVKSMSSPKEQLERPF